MPTVQHLCPPGVIKDLQAELVPQKVLAFGTHAGMLSAAADLDPASWVLQNSGHPDSQR